MARSCRLSRGGRSDDAQWRRDGDSLVVTPAGGPALVVPIERIAGIAGDGHTLRLALAEGELALERLGADGPTLLGELRRDWPPLRAAALRLAGDGLRGEVFAGTIAAPDVRGSFRGLVAGGRLLLAVEGGDLTPVFPADWSALARDDAASCVRCTGWDGAESVFSRLGAKTVAFGEALQGAREALALAAQGALSRNLPTLGAAARAGLSAQWLPGRLLSVELLERVAPGFQRAFEASWLAALPRAREGRSLMHGVAAADCRIAYASAAGDGQRQGRDEDLFVWLLVRRADSWSLELLSHGDHATYRFRGGAEVPSLVEGLVRLPEFSREALYLPLEELVGDRFRYLILATDLPLLRDLRAHFLDRIIHAAEPGAAKE